MDYFNLAVCIFITIASFIVTKEGITALQDSEEEMIKATIVVNRKVLFANQKATAVSQTLVDNPAISIRTYLGTVYAKEVEFRGNAKLKQDAANATCNGATVWVEAYLEQLIIDGVRGNKDMFLKTKEK